MPFRHGILSPQTISDPRAQAILGLVANAPETPLQAGHILFAALHHGDSVIRNVFEQAVQQGSLEQLASTVAGHFGEAGQVPPRKRNEFSAGALRALDEFGTILRGSAGVLNPVAAELLVHFALIHLEPAEQATWACIDTAKAAALFRQLVGRAMLPNLDQDEAESDQISEDHQADDARTRSRLIPPQIAPSEDWTWQAQQANRDETYPFECEPIYQIVFDALARALHRRQHPHALLVGERGVGKTTVLADFARQAAFGQISFLAEHRFLRVDGRYIPPDESRPRLAALLAHIVGHADLVVCLDGLAVLLRGERSSNKPALLESLTYCRCRLVGFFTPQEYEELVADDPEFADLFTRVDVPEPPHEAALRLTAHFARGLAERYQVTIDEEAVRQAVALSANYILNDQLPSKAVRVLTQACEKADYDQQQLGRPWSAVSAEHIIQIVSERSGVPAETLRGIADRTDYEPSLREVIFGQDHAVHEVATELGLIKAGMTDPTKPASVMLFLGQTGTGKTEMAKVLARFYSTSKRLKTYTLGNCVEPHSVATIIGVPPGYVGNDRGGRLVNELNADPYCVVLLDEADKAHPDVLQPFLNLFDEGWVTDQRGVKAYGSKAIFILTTNVGQRMIAELAKEGKTVDEIASRMKEALSQIRHGKSDRPVFTPEFLARIKRVIVFKPLDEAAMHAIAQKQLSELKKNWLGDRQKELDLPPELGNYLGTAAYRLDRQANGKEGGRIVRKLMAEWLESPLQRAISHQANDYRKTLKITVAFTRPPDPPEDKPFLMPTIAVQFNSE